MDPTANFDSDRRSSRGRHIWGFGALAASILLLAAMTFNAFHAVGVHRDAERWHRHTLQVLLVAEQTRSAINQALRGERGYLLTRERRFLGSFEDARRDAPVLAAQLRRLTIDNPLQRQDLRMLDGLLARYLEALAGTTGLALAGREADAIAVVRSGRGRSEFESLLVLLDRIEATERRLLDQRAAASAAARRNATIANVALPTLALIFLITVGFAGYGASRARMRTLGMEEQLRRAATTDELTGLLNRRAFIAALDTELSRVARSGAPLSLAIVDLDHFKGVNDRFGHHGGDQVLRRFAEIARETMRTADAIGRLGGEEFAILMPETDHGEAGVACERLRRALAQRRIVLESGAPVPVTTSIGVARHLPGETGDQLMRRADEALYEAKETGRNRTRLAA